MPSDEIRPDRVPLEGRERVLAQALWDVWAALGHDTDGDAGPWAWIAGSGVENFARGVLSDAREYRAECEEEMERQYHEAQAAEAVLDRLEKRLAAEERRTAERNRRLVERGVASLKTGQVIQIVPMLSVAEVRKTLAGE